MTRPLTLVLLATLAIATGCQSENNTQQTDAKAGTPKTESPENSSTDTPNDPTTPKDPTPAETEPDSATSTGGSAPSGDLAALRDRLAQDSSRQPDAAPSRSDLQAKQAELRELARKLLEGVAEKGRPAIDAYLMSSDTIDTIYKPTHANIMKMSLDQRRDAAWSQLAETIGVAHPQFLTVQVGDITRAEEGALFKSETWTAKDLTIEFLVAGVPHRTILRTAVLTDSGWRFLQYETKGPHDQ